MASLFIDTSGLFTSVSEKQSQQQSKQKAENEKKRKAHDYPMESSNVKKMYPGPSNTMDMDFDEVDLDLYGDQNESEAAEKPASIAMDNLKPTDNTIELDDDDAMLYRDETKEQTDSQIDQSAGGIDEINVSIQGGMGEVTRISYWCIMYTTDGCLKVWEIR